MNSAVVKCLVVSFLCLIFARPMPAASPAGTQVVPMHKVVRNSLDFAVRQSLLMAKSLESKPGVLPRTISAEGKLETAKPSAWISGFFPGELWYLYEYTKDSELKKYADEFTQRVRSQMYTTDNHDVGFMIFCSFGNGYRLTRNPDYKAVIDTAAWSLSTRFNPAVGAIRSWNFSYPGHNWQYAVIIDNMMNLELLMWASKTFNNEKLRDIAISHADKTLKYHFRPDYSSFHVVSYDPKTGLPEFRHTAQGYSDASSWARGQAWGLYGYTMMYRETKKPEYLEQAKHIAKFILSNPHLPADKIPYWDFDAPDIPNAYRDASAGAIICSSLIELSQYVDATLSKGYLKVAEMQLRALGSPSYRANAGENGNFILRHSVGNKPANSEVDVPLSYADYYFVEALMRYKKTVLHE
ncbi:MAG: glycoside hydrolase family 88 protein [Bacteroidota bacterium]|nr:glycoside hydrolase family 88 protein [Bacteroidota bacterium]